MHPLPGNPLPRYKEIDLGASQCVGSINSEGLPNKGIDYYLTDEACQAGVVNDKPYIVSLSGYGAPVPTVATHPYPPDPPPVATTRGCPRNSAEPM